MRGKQIHSLHYFCLSLYVSFPSLFCSFSISLLQHFLFPSARLPVNTAQFRPLILFSFNVFFPQSLFSLFPPVCKTEQPTCPLHVSFWLSPFPIFSPLVPNQSKLAHIFCSPPNFLSPFPLRKLTFIFHSAFLSFTLFTFLRFILPPSISSIFCHLPISPCKHRPHLPFLVLHSTF